MDILGRIAIALIAYFSSWAAFVPIGYGFSPVTLSLAFAWIFSVVAVLQRRIFRVRQVDLWFFAYVVVLLVSAILSDRQFSAMYGWRLWVSFFFGYAATRILFRAESSLMILVWAGILAAVTTVLNLAPAVNEWGDIGRVEVEGLNTNFTAYAVTGYLYVFLLAISRYDYQWHWNALHLCIIAFLFYILTTLETRGALIASTFMLVYWRLGARIPVILVRIAVFVAIAWSLLLAFGYLDALLLLLDSLGGRSTGDLSGRGQIWAEARVVFAENWIIGVGPSQFLFLSNVGVGTHNFFLTVGLDSGVVGLFVMLGFVYSLGRILSRATLGPRRINIGMMFFAYWVPIAMSGHWELAVWSWVVIAASVQMAEFSAKGQRKASAERESAELESR